MHAANPFIATTSVLKPNRATDATSSLPDPDGDASKAKDVLIYDGQCNFCRRSVRTLYVLDWTRRLTFISLHDERVPQRWPGLSYDQLMDQIWLASPGGETYGGADALRYLSLRMPAMWLSAPLLNFPFTMPLWRKIYRFIARNRYRIAGRSCEGGTCSLHGK